LQAAVELPAGDLERAAELRTRALESMLNRPSIISSDFVSLSHVGRPSLSITFASAQLASAAITSGAPTTYKYNSCHSGHAQVNLLRGLATTHHPG